MCVQATCLVELATQVDRDVREGSFRCTSLVQMLEGCTDSTRWFSALPVCRLRERAWMWTSCSLGTLRCSCILISPTRPGSE